MIKNCTTLFRLRYSRFINFAQKNGILTQTNKRLWFIDAARSIAIIMMLQGHFISLTFEDYDIMRGAISTDGTSGNIFFDAWFFLRGLTAPLFFFIVGVVFVYLLLGETTLSYFRQKRVRKGFQRALMVILWGYIIQLNWKNLDYYLSGRINVRFYGFHVLQSIGVGILSLLVFYAIYLLIKRIRFSILLFAGGLLIFTLYPLIDSFGSNYLPSAAPEIIQNAIHGPNSFFPIFPWLGFVLFGGCVGALLREMGSKVRDKWFPLKFILCALLAGLGALGVLYFVNLWCMGGLELFKTLSCYAKLAEVILVIGLLMYLERYSKDRNTLFLRMGQNTLIIYILHVIVLYGALIGIGLKTYYKDALNASQTILGAIAFILFFALLTKIQPFVIRALKSIIRQLISKRSKAD